MGKSKSVILSILRKLEETGSWEAKKPPGRPRKTTAKEDRRIGNESKKDWFATAIAIAKRTNANLGIKISRHIISRGLNEMNLNCQVISTKPYISKNKTKWVDWNLPLNTSYGVKNSGIVFISATSQNLTSSVVTGKGSFNVGTPQCTKSNVIFGGGSVMVFIIIQYSYRTSCEAKQKN